MVPLIKHVGLLSAASRTKTHNTHIISKAVGNADGLFSSYMLTMLIFYTYLRKFTYCIKKHYSLFLHGKR